MEVLIHLILLKNGSEFMGRKMKFDIGDKLRDKISGFEGIVTAKTEWYNGCKRYRLEPDKLNPETGGLIEDETFDEDQLEKVRKVKVRPPTKPTGGSRPNDTRPIAKSR